MTKIFAHRGYRKKYPENTLLAFRAAIDAGCDGIELDVQLSKDNQVVVIHDEKLWRTTNGRGAVRDMTYEQLSELDAGHGERIPLLSEYFDLVEKLPLVTNIELKNRRIPYEGMEELILQMIRERDLSDRIIFSSFNHDSVNKLKQLAPDINCGYICRGRLDGDFLARKMCESKVDFIHPALWRLNAKFMESVEQHNMRISVWTVNFKRSIRRLIEQGVYGILTDDPPLLREVIRHLEAVLAPITEKRKELTDTAVLQDDEPVILTQQ